MWISGSYFWSPQYIKQRLCIKPGIQERGTECEECGEWGNVNFGECGQTFQKMPPNIPGNVAKHSGKCCQTFQGISPNIPGNVIKIFMLFFLPNRIKNYEEKNHHKPFNALNGSITMVAILMTE